MKEQTLRYLRTGALYVTLAGTALLVGRCVSNGAMESGTTLAPQGAESLFNGTDLTGWNGDPRVWRVENGAIVAQTTAETPIQSNTFLIWEGGTVEDFDLKLSFRLTGGNSGVQYRSTVVEGWTVSGYQADMDAANQYTGMLYEERGRGIIAWRSQQVVIEPDGRFTVTGSVGDPDELTAAIDMSDWNVLEISARGNHLVHKVNGRVTVDVIDNQVEERADSGILALQIHTGPPMKAEFKDITLTRLSPASAAR